MRLLFTLIVLVIGNQAEAKERRWECRHHNGKLAISLFENKPCPIGTKAYEIDENNKIIPNGYDPYANETFTRCKVFKQKNYVYGLKECLYFKGLGWTQGDFEKVNREGFTPEEARIDAKRRENLAKQKEWEQGKNVNRPLTGGLSVEGQITTKQHDDCQSWKNSNIIDPTPEKQKYIKENC